MAILHPCMHGVSASGRMGPSSTNAYQRLATMHPRKEERIEMQHSDEMAQMQALL